METMEVTMNDLRAHQGAIFAHADNGGQVVIKRRHKPAYILAPIAEDDEEDNFFTPEMIAKYDHMADDYYAGKLKPAAAFDSREDIINYFEERHGKV